MSKRFRHIVLLLLLCIAAATAHSQTADTSLRWQLGSGLEPSAITEEVFASALQTADIPDPDLIMRTAGEQRLSNFLLWQCSYAEFLFIDTLWPDFAEQDFVGALNAFSQRQRRYGKA